MNGRLTETEVAKFFVWREQTRNTHKRIKDRVKETPRFVRIIIKKGRFVRMRSNRERRENVLGKSVESKSHYQYRP